MAVYFIIVFLIVVILVSWFRFVSVSKGKMGEKAVAKILQQLPEDQYRVVNNMLVRNGDTTTQIDHIVVSLYGIFVIETKDYTGHIYGGVNSDSWTQNYATTVF